MAQYLKKQHMMLACTVGQIFGLPLVQETLLMRIPDKFFDEPNKDFPKISSANIKSIQRVLFPERKSKHLDEHNIADIQLRSTIGKETASSVKAYTDITVNGFDYFCPDAYGNSSEASEKHLDSDKSSALNRRNCINHEVLEGHPHAIVENSDSKSGEGNFLYV